MLTTEILMIMSFVLLSAALYMLYRYFNDIIDDMYNELKSDINNLRIANNTSVANESYKIKEFEKELEELQKRMKYQCMDDMLVVSSTLSNRLDKFENKLNLIEKNQTGSIKVIIPEHKKETNAIKKHASTKTQINRNNKSSGRSTAE